MLFHPQMQRFGTPLGKPRVISAWNRANGVLQEAELLCKCVVMCWKDESAHDDVGVAIDVLCDAMKNDVGPLKEWRRIKGRKEGIVYKH